MDRYGNCYFLKDKLQSCCRYMSVYKPFSYLLRRDSDRAMEKFIHKGHPLRDYRKELERLKHMESSVASLPVYVPMNVFLLDCSHINKVGVWAYICVHTRWTSLREIVIFWPFGFSEFTYVNSQKWRAMSFY